MPMATLSSDRPSTNCAVTSKLCILQTLSHKLCCYKQTVYPSDSVTQTVPQHRNNEYIHSNNAYAITLPQS